MKLSAIALDDEPASLEIIQFYSEMLPDSLEMLGAFTSVSDARAFLQVNTPDLLFVDIQMPMLNGLDFYRLFGKGKMLILTTAYREFAWEGFDLEAIDYLLKPFDFLRFQRSVEKALKSKISQQVENRLHLVLKSGQATQKVPLDLISYIEAMGDYLRMYMDGSKPIVTRIPMKEMIQLLNDEFIQIHRSYIVRIDRLTTVASNYVRIDQKKLPIGKTFGQIDWNKIPGWKDSKFHT